MEEDERRYFVEMLDKQPSDFLYNLSSKIKINSNSSKENVHKLLDMIDDKINDVKNSPLKKYMKHVFEDEEEGETLLHIAVKYSDDSEMIRRIVKMCPELLTFSRGDSKIYKGQTPLHIAITKRDYEVTKLLLSDSKQMKSILKTKATGSIFTNTVMMGELPLHVAALTLDENIMEILLDKKPKMRAKNSCGDTVFHSLVKYAAIYPNKSDSVIKMFTYLTDKIKEKEISSNGRYKSKDTDIILKNELYMWVLENNDSLTPLQLSAKLGVVEIFQYIINLENVYSFVSTHDGLFDVKLYDITEIDTVANQHVATIRNANVGSKHKKVARNVVGVPRITIKSNTRCDLVKCDQFDYPKTESILEMMFDYDFQSQSAFRIIETIPVKNIILEKWQKFKKFYFLWGFIHLFMTVSMTAELVIRSELYAVETTPNTTTAGNHVSVSSKRFACGVSWMSLFLGGVVYCFIFISLLIAKARRPNALRYILHNLEYVFFLIVFSVCLFIDFFMAIAKEKHDNIALILAVISGWWFSVFFLRAFRLFSFFTEMIKRVIIGDLFRFAVFISFMFFAFTAGIYAAFVGSMDAEQKTPSYHNAVNEHFSSFGGAMLTMFKLMLGLDDFGVLNEARIPGLAIALYIVFALLTYVLLLNSLIAMMSQTCAVVLENRYPQWRLQQLSVVLFLEDILCMCCIRQTFKSPGTLFFPEKEISYSNQITKQPNVRYFFKIHSLQTIYASEEDREAMTSKVKEQIRMKGLLQTEMFSTADIPQLGTLRIQSINKELVRDTTSEIRDKSPKRKRREKRPSTMGNNKPVVDYHPNDVTKAPPQVDIESNPKFK